METNKIEKDSFKLMYRTALAMQEKRESETKRGQKEDWTGKKGLKNTIS